MQIVTIDGHSVDPVVVLEYSLCMANLKDELLQSPVGVDPFAVHIRNWVHTLRMKSHGSTVVHLVYGQFLKNE
jgi:hypothetical protein